MFLLFRLASPAVTQEDTLQSRGAAVGGSAADKYFTFLPSPMECFE